MSKFEIQAFLLYQLRFLGYIVSAEVRLKNTGVADLVIYENQMPIFGIEVKFAVTSNQESNKLTEQMSRYHGFLGVPFCAIVGMEDAIGFIEEIKQYGLQLDNRIPIDLRFKERAQATGRELRQAYEQRKLISI